MLPLSQTIGHFGFFRYKKEDETYLGSANSNTDVYIVSVYDVITINDSIDNWLVLKCRNSSLPK